MECPKCGRTVEDGAFICPGCEFILDTSFLGDDITDDDRALRKKRERERASARAGESNKSDVHFGEDAMILGNPAEQEWSDFGSRDAGMSQREVTQARFYVGGSTAALLSPDAVPEVVASAFAGSIRLTPFEHHVIDFINGKRSIGRIQKKSGMEDSEFKTSVAMLADKGIIRLRTTKKKKRSSQALSSLQVSLPEQTHLAGSMSGLQADGDRTVVATAKQSSQLGVKQSRSKLERPVLSAVEQAAALDDSGRDGHPDDLDPGADGDEAEPSGSSKSGSSQVRRTPFRSLRAEPPEVPPNHGRDGGWGGDENPVNISNVFARARAAQKKPRASLVEPLPPLQPQGAARGAQDEPRDRRAALQPPEDEVTAGLPEHAQPDGGGSGEDLLFAPASGDAGSADELVSAEAEPVDDADVHAVSEQPDDAFEERSATALARPRSSAHSDHASAARDAAGDADEEGAQQPRDAFDVPTGKRRSFNTSNTMTRERPGFDKLQDPTGIGAAPLPPPQREIALEGGRIHDEQTAARDITSDPTGPLPPDDDLAPPPSAADAFDVDLHTASLPAVPTAASPFVPELPPDALVAVPSGRFAAPTLGIPGQNLVGSGGAPAQPAPPALPGQALLRGPMTGGGGPAARPTAPSQPSVAAPGGPQARPPTIAKPGAARPSAASTVPFEQARKAEKIFEQAQKDFAAGKLSSARMNAKLAAQFDTSVPTYKDFLAELENIAAGAPKPGNVKPRELVLFEDASAAEGRGDYERAVKLLEEAIAINPKAGALHNRLGVVLSIRLKRHDEAMAVLKRAIELEPGSLVYMNNFSKVTAMLESALEKDPDSMRRKSRGDEQKVAIKKMRPKMF